MTADLNCQKIKTILDLIFSLDFLIIPCYTVYES